MGRVNTNFSNQLKFSMKQAKCEKNTSRGITFNESRAIKEASTEKIGCLEAALLVLPEHF